MDFGALSTATEKDDIVQGIAYLFIDTNILDQYQFLGNHGVYGVWDGTCRFEDEQDDLKNLVSESLPDSQKDTISSQIHKGANTQMTASPSTVIAEPPTKYPDDFIQVRSKLQRRKAAKEKREKSNPINPTKQKTKFTKPIQGTWNAAAIQPAPQVSP